MSPEKILKISALFALTLLAASIAAADEKERAERGGTSYRVYCQNCHGRTGEGDGPIAEVLKVRPADLTRLAARNDGSFPSNRVYQTIDGRNEVVSHGSREMPIWGLSFQDPERDSAQEAEVRERILDLVAFLRTLQVEEGKDGR